MSLEMQIAIASEADRETIYRLRHEVYAVELGQHPTNSAGRLTDACDGNNLYLVARMEGRIAGFISLTMPGATYAVEKYLSRESLPFPIDAATYEVRLLTVCDEDRGGLLAGLLMYAALRMVEARRGTLIMAMGRRDLKPLYQNAGLRFQGIPIRSGAVEYELMAETVTNLRRHLSSRLPYLRRLRSRCVWDLPVAFDDFSPCVHGGAFFEAIGPTFQTLERRHDVVNADVLDAWFPPAPGVLTSVRDHLPWLLRTSPPADGKGLVHAIGAARGVAPESLAIGGGSSALIYLALRQWLTADSRVLLPDPTYGEYAHVLERVVGCRLDRLALSPESGYYLDLSRLLSRLRRAADQSLPYTMIVLVNPNNPTGQHLSRPTLEAFVSSVPPSTIVWIDEAYIDYLGPGESLEVYAAQSTNVIVCKSLSKCYALSGARAAYLCGPPVLMQELRFLTPPWSISLPAQVAASAALRDPDYYRRCYAETAALREHLAGHLRRALPSLEIRQSPANWLLCRLPLSGPDAATVSARCRTQDVFLRDAGSISPRLGTHSLRIAVKDTVGNDRIVSAVASALGRP